MKRNKDRRVVWISLTSQERSILEAVAASELVTIPNLIRRACFDLAEESGVDVPDDCFIELKPSGRPVRRQSLPELPRQFTVRDYARVCSLSREAANSQIRRLLKLDRIRLVGTQPSTRRPFNVYEVCLQAQQ